MKSSEKKVILLLIIVLIVVIVVAVKRNNKGEVEKPKTTQIATETEQKEEEPKEKYVEVLEDGTKLNTSETLKTAKMVEGLEFKNIQLTNKDGQSVLLADVTNTKETATEIMLVNVIILDDAGEEIGKVGGIIAPLAPGATTQFNTSTTMDYANAADFKIEKAEN